ncbi:hypothetical protein [Burkholderia paludis]|uniref:hypothetical protein n=1 Tax=Burkholderia paludis TaxID=1506587 RepID=UPI001269C648|nr:hypothetical protein [Burkholderia paludis]
MNATLPTEDQREALCDLIASAFVELRYLDGEQAHDLAYAFHNLPKEIYGWGSWSIDATRNRFRHYQTKHAGNVGFDYVAAFNSIFPEIR